MERPATHRVMRAGPVPSFFDRGQGTAGAATRFTALSTGGSDLKWS